MRVKLLVLAAAGIIATPAVAQDGASNGFRAETRVGFDRAELEIEYEDGVESFDESDGTSGIAYGVEAGYDFNIGTGVVGPYAGLDLSTTDYCSEVFGDDQACIEAGRNITVGLRAGAMLSPGMLLYVKGGYTNGKVTLDYEDFEDILEDFEESEKLGGYHLGAGAEVGFGQNLYGKLEYVYTDYDGYEYEDTLFTAGADLSRHQVMLGFGIRM